MSTSIHRLGLDNDKQSRAFHAPVDHEKQHNGLRVQQEQLQDKFQISDATRTRGIKKGSGDSLVTGGTQTDGGKSKKHSNDTINDLADSTSIELQGVHDSLNSGIEKVESPPPSPPQLPPGDLVVNEDGSITTPGGYTIFNDGGHQWRIQDPSGIETKIFGDPHVDEGNDGTVDWHFNQDGSFILPDGTKIFCDTDTVQGQDGKVVDGITTSSVLKIQYQDQLGTMDVAKGGPGTVEETGGLAYDKGHKDGQLYVMGTDGKFYDGKTLGKLYDAGGDFARDVAKNKLGHITENALISLTSALAETKEKLENKDPLAELDPVFPDEEPNELPDDDDLEDEDGGDVATLLALDDNAFIVDDTDGEVGKAIKGKRAIDEGHILGQANQADGGFEALADFDLNGDGVVSGAELDGVKVWVDADDDGIADAGEIKLLTEFKVDSLKVKATVQHDKDGTTKLEGEFEKEGKLMRSNDRLTPLNDGPQARNFARQLHDLVGGDHMHRAIAQRQLDIALQRLTTLRRDNQMAEKNADLARHANDTHHMQRPIRG